MATRNLGKDSGTRSDFDDEFDLLVRQKGYRALWSRAVMCPCRLNTKTDQADPSCPSCGGDGWFYVLPEEADNLQAYVDAGFEDTANAKATQVVVTGIAKNVEIYETFGEWVFGQIRCTTFGFHRMAYRDRLVFCDAVTEYQQILEVPATSRTIPVGNQPKTNVRYPVKAILAAWEVASNGTRTNHCPAMSVEADGSITFDDANVPAAGTLVTVVYQHAPVYVILESVLDLRQSPRKFKTTSVLGDILEFPKLLLAKPDYLPDRDTT